MNPETSLYLDHAATTPMWPEARAAMLPFLDEEFSNASAVYAGARAARKAIEEARETLASLVGARPEEVVFTSGGTEADNLALQGAAWRGRDHGRDTVVVSAIEHHAVLDTAEWLQRRGFRARIVPVTPGGIVDLDALEAAVDERTAIVSVMAANNEVGTLQPVERAAEIARARGALFHTDAVQALAWMPVRADLADMTALAAHKAGGPKGAGALIVRRGVGIEALLHGGGQERGRRSGTYNVAGIAGFGAAARMTSEQRDLYAPRVRAVRDRLQDALRARVPGLRVTVDHDLRLPNNLHVTIDGVESESMLLLLDGAGVAASAGSACQSGALEPSHVLTAMGVDVKRARGALRLTLGRDATPGDADAAAAHVCAVVETLRR